MKLFTPKQVKETVAEKNQEQAQKNLSLLRQAKELNEKVVELEDIYNARREEIERETVDIINNYEKKLSGLKTEVTELSKERERLLIPINKLWEEVELARLEISSKEQELKDRELSIVVGEDEIKQEKSEIVKLRKTLSKTIDKLELRIDLLKEEEERVSNAKLDAKLLHDRAVREHNQDKAKAQEVIAKLKAQSEAQKNKEQYLADKERLMQEKEEQLSRWQNRLRKKR